MDTPANTPMGSRPHENLGVHLGVRLSRSRAADGACRYRTPCAESEPTRKQFVRSPFTHHQHDHVRLGAADLETKTPALDPDRRRCSPARSIFPTADSESVSILRAYYKAGVLEAGHNDDAFRSG